MYRKPTIKTIAQLAGVSHVAVSRALRGCSDISAETKERILKIAQEIGYTPNAAARSLSSKRATSVGMIVPTLAENTAYSAVFNQISMVAAEHGCTVLLGSSHRSLELERKHCQMMCENRVGALIVSPSGSNVSHIKEACHGLFPVIFMGGKIGFEEDFVLTLNYKHSAKLVVEYLYQLGHSDIALFTYAPENNTILQKKDGFIQEMKKCGLAPRMYTAGHADDTSTAGQDLVEQLIMEDTLPTAIWCASDLMAMGVLSTLRNHGIRVPEDISLIGHDDLYFGRLPGIELTTLHTPMKELGDAAMQLALGLMEREQVEAHQIFHPSLVIRGTTGPAPNKAQRQH
ncbi:MAG: LacI family DNA-binding transcriptional regulator [Anaerotignum sp.]|nr:LacI family DNA-binding transcriptional regulator [Anaerotignum sp.]